MAILQPTALPKFPFSWVDLDSYPNSKATRAEIYLKNEEFEIADLEQMFDDIFGNIKSDILIYSTYWWNFCLDTWNIHTDTYDYFGNHLSEMTKNYNDMLLQSDLPLDYSESCICNNWEHFLTVTLPCIVSGVAPYGHTVFSEEHQFFFYFHHTGSIGFYYFEECELIKGMMDTASLKYDVRIICGN